MPSTGKLRKCDALCPEALYIPAPPVGFKGVEITGWRDSPDIVYTCFLSKNDFGGKRQAIEFLWLGIVCSTPSRKTWFWNATERFGFKQLQF